MSKIATLPIRDDFKALTKAPVIKRKGPLVTLTAAPADVPAVARVILGNSQDAATSVPAVPARRTSWSLTAVAVGFFGLGVAINVWNAMSGDLATTALPATMGVLAEAAAFLIPARLVGLPAARRTLGIAILVFVTAFALVNSLRMASIVAADTASARADRTTEGTRAADMALDVARKARDEACGRGQGKTVACVQRVSDVGKAETARSAAGARVASQARPESGDFAKLVTWLSRGTVTPGAADFDMLWLLFRTVTPVCGGLILMIARK